MIREPRQVGLKTIFDLVKQKKVYFTLGLVFTLTPFAFGAILLFVATLIDSQNDLDGRMRKPPTYTA